MTTTTAQRHAWRDAGLCYDCGSERAPGTHEPTTPTRPGCLRDRRVTTRGGVAGYGEGCRRLLRDARLGR